MSGHCRLLLLIMGFSLGSMPVLFAAPKVLFVSPSHAGDPFFQYVEQYARIASEDLGLELEVIYGDGNRLLQLQQLESYLKQQQPHYIVVQPYSGGTKALMDLLAGYPQLKVITFERILLASEEMSIGVPGQHYSNWIAEIYFDNARASLALSKALLEACRSQAKAGRHDVIGLNGAHGFESEERGRMIVELSRHDPDYRFQQLVYSQWQRDLAARQSQQLLRRYPKTSVIWAASDWIALGVLDMLNEQATESASYCIGGFDWLPEGIAAIQNGQLSASVGGHYMMGAWAMVAVYDHWQGALPAGKLAGSPAFALEVISSDNVQQYLPLLQPDYWQNFDFRSLTFRHQPEQSHYAFQLLAK